MNQLSSIAGQVATKERDDSSFFHHRRKLVNLNWDSEPTKVSIFIQPGIPNIEENVDMLIDFLKEFKIKFEVDKFTNSDFIILVGTDGINLTVSSLFQDRETPPILSLTPTRKGFISVLDFCQYNLIIPQILRDNCWLLPRCRLVVDYYSLEGLQHFTVLNDLVVNRDHTSGSLAINCSSCGFGFSQIVGDGVIIATPTGSTAYNKGAGGALVHPLLPVFMLTPIVALSLSCRPILFPQSADLTLELDYDHSKMQSHVAYLTLDGRVQRLFKKGEKLVVSISPHYYNSITMSKSIAEWPVRLAGLMGWSERKHQKALPAQNSPK
ncbi:ATP-NAD kinase family protein [Trichomonas vaginalis G3]|uniref:ATP-NAD kinase family protein n=1 Tax=Trichomonas vaginalis (strain ATCC PRA-98 / G3) TaxID=412133 RepID=A2ET29_TRIV3|nr:NADP biosynthetic process [Trichomonas vaginalis G3]EAY04218.1 ATP-NAD kinase family protein [Trichomonas vaginalis G3]KAI5493092.1 NADP biosynthetic process [Trichomonas vaginalis G3]|eukprot:XP_001316441.1 ATP-NAD kinase family protein [Trichomonas vaginalis G3]